MVNWLRSTKYFQAPSNLPLHLHQQSIEIPTPNIQEREQKHKTLLSSTKKPCTSFSTPQSSTYLTRSVACIHRYRKRSESKRVRISASAVHPLKIRYQIKNSIIVYQIKVSIFPSFTCVINNNNIASKRNNHKSKAYLPS